MISKSRLGSRCYSLFLGALLALAPAIALSALAGSISLQDINPSSQSTAPSSLLSNSSGFSSPEFLPVEQAYRLNPQVAHQKLVLDWTIAPGYYLYKDQFAIKFSNGESGDESNAQILTKTQALAMEFQEGQFIYDDYYEKNLEVFYHSTQVRATLPTAESSTSSTQNPSIFTLAITTQGCADAGLCYPPRTEYLAVNIDQGTVQFTEQPSANSAQSQRGNSSDSMATNRTANAQASRQGGNIFIVLLFALLGGIILNLMPCVFPVLSIKVMATTSAHLGDHNKHVHSLAYSAGIILSFMAIAALMLGLRASGEVIGWGFQLQSPLFVALLAYLLFVIAQSFSGQLTIGGSWMNLGQNFTQSNSVSGSFMTGVLATVVASPCTAPFMGTALGVALTQSTGMSMAIFATLGLGMALPFLMLSWIPGLMEKLPAPGPWMNTFSQLLAFPLYASVIWLLWVLGRQTSIDHAIMVSLGVLLLAFAIWLHHHAKPIIARVLLVLSLVAALWLAIDREPTDQEQLWQPYSPALLTDLRREGKAVFINLTADWCITCLANEKMALSSEAFKSALVSHNISYLKGDWTNNNPDITRLLNEHGRSGVPLYLYYDAAGSPAKILPQLLSQKVVLNMFTENP